MTNKLLKSGFYNTAGGAIRVGLALLTIPILIHLLGVEEYGLWVLASTVLGLVALAEAGLAMATTVFISQDLGKEDIDGLSQTLTVTVGAVLVMATLAAVLLWVSSEAIVSLFPKLEQVQERTIIQALQLGGLAVWARLLQQVLIGIEQAYQRYGLINLLNTLQWVLLSLGLFAIAYRGGHTIELMYWQVALSLATLLSHVCVARFLLQGISPRWAWNLKKGVAIVHYSLMSWATSLGGAIFLRCDRLIVGSFLGSETLAIYAAITDAAGAINLLSSLPVQPLLPILSHQSENFSHPQVRQQVKQFLEINGFVALAMGSFLFIFAPFIMSIMIGHAVNKGNIFAFQAAAVIYALYSLNAVGYYVLLSLAINIGMLIVLASGCLTIALIFVGTNTFGLLGAVLGNLGYLTTWLLLFFAMQKLNFASSLWIQALAFPLVWFLSCILVSLYIPENFEARLALFSAQIIIMLFWFLSAQQHNRKLAKH